VIGKSRSRSGNRSLADDGRALLAITGPCLGEAVTDPVIALDAERVLDDLGGAVPANAKRFANYEVEFGSLFTLSAIIVVSCITP